MTHIIVNSDVKSHQMSLYKSSLIIHIIKNIIVFHSCFNIIELKISSYDHVFTSHWGIIKCKLSRAFFKVGEQLEVISAQ